MQNSDDFLALYNAKKVQGRSDLCPRIGYYKIISVYQDFCFGKISTIAKAHWKLRKSDSYSDLIVTVQLQSFKKGDNPLISNNIIDCEIEVSKAIWLPNIASFDLNWELKQKPIFNTREINKLFSRKIKDFNIAHVDSMSCGKEVEDGSY
ncbi:hypothetical protein EZ456_23745 [Pedobacter psychrodurus]|uniref:Uncharacterized protein n=1 Tax=Pedobacter psychrodurus TaxID=2530456 RepID=A0A4R0PKL3_9SPHI|nr:hypothetical protein [Pedobacter psychrodurus]TCD16965.1 hypothetical protein EZ456_23745 [Pedobacter psychrodurus]